ncbi:hypothetical protein [Spiroplasma tabanidicola]|uniref:Lipoprotein n=1 Tax=Spiroplasma tabanidicola TaxID=324079 RepID=A0A6I6CJ48_9MOLU|nr:hypothetical protein [Spiroplasma tabanidicola]QGS52093.1 hypothetical protein STABA_v1c07370 [Spiroplasma tabanidicola]
MKKIMSLLMTVLMGSASTSLVASCEGGAGMSWSYSDQQKILSLTTLDTKKLKENNVKMGAGIEAKNADAIIAALGFSDIVKNGDKAVTGAFMSSLRTYIMSNQLVTQIAQKVPGFGWLYSKLQWQASKWNLRDLLNLNKGKQALAENAAGWLGKNDWSVSVTFLNDELVGWTNPKKAPAYARININRSIKVNSDTSVDVKNSTVGAVWKEPKNDKIPLAVDPISSSSNTQTEKRGVIYQGFTNSSTLIELANIFDETDTSLPASILGYSPSVSDFVNNILLNSQLINRILKEKQEEIKDKVSTNLKNNQIILSESTDIFDIENRMRNQVFSVVFMELIKRNNLIGDATPIEDEDKIEAARVWSEFFAQLIENTKMIINIVKDDELKQKLQDDLTYYSELQDNNAQNNVKEEDISNLYERMDRTFFSSRYLSLGAGEQKDFTSKEFNLTMYDFSLDLNSANSESNSSKWVYNKIKLENVRDYLFFGLNFNTLFKMNYYYKEFIKEDEENEVEMSKYWYDPDAENVKLMPSSTNEFVEWYNKTEFISDIGFNNLFIQPRISGLLSKYLKYNSAHVYLTAKAEDNAYGSTNDTMIFLDLFADENGNVPSNVNELISLLKKYNSNIDDDKDKFRIRYLMDIISSLVDQKILTAFDVQNQALATDLLTPRDVIRKGNIWTYDISSDFAGEEGVDNWELIKKRLNINDIITEAQLFNQLEKNDDKQFAAHLSNLKNNFNGLPFHAAPVDVLGSGESQLRNGIYKEGTKSINNYVSNISLQYSASILNNYGEVYETYKSLDRKTWWKLEGNDIMDAQVPMLLKIFYENQNEDVISQLWDQLVRLNENNIDWYPGNDQ